ncbi:hypothetical protein K0U07_03575 [bacterium]|nr:hypothetical protein [bacterium]
MRFLLLVLVPFCLFADTGADPFTENASGKPKGPWLTGPLLTTSAYTVAANRFNLEPYVFFTDSTGFFDSGGHVHRTENNPRAINSVELIQIGLNEWIDLNIYPQFTYNYDTRGRNRIGMGDLTISPTFQLWRDDPRYHMTTCKIGLSQIFPCGKFENLNPIYDGSDGLGSGGWSTEIFLAIQRTFHVRKENFFVGRAALSTIFYSPLEVHGQNFYGGDPTTDGTLERGISVILDCSLEYTLSLHWALAIDMEQVYATGSTFQGTTIAPVGREQQSYLLSFAPAVEFNYSENVGFICGVWFAAYGSNADDFFNVVMALNLYF